MNGLYRFLEYDYRLTLDTVKSTGTTYSDCNNVKNKLCGKNKIIKVKKTLRIQETYLLKLISPTRSYSRNNPLRTAFSWKHNVCKRFIKRIKVRENDLQEETNVKKVITVLIFVLNYFKIVF